MEITEIEMPKYIGECKIFEGLFISLTKMPTKKEQENMEKTFGWKFTSWK